MSENMKIKIKYKDFIQLENYQKSLINFLMKDAYVSCNGIYEGTKASYYFYESENHWMKITAKQLGDIGNTYKIKFYKWENQFVVETTKENEIPFKDHDTFTMARRSTITVNNLNDMEGIRYNLSDYFEFEGVLTFDKLPDKDVDGDPEYMQLSGGSDTPVLQEYFMYAQAPSSDIETYNESIGHYLYHGEYIASDLSYKFGVEVKQGVTSDVALLFRRGRSSEVNTLYISLRTDPGSSPSELAHQAFASGKETLVPSDLNNIQVDSDITLWDLFKFTGSIPWNHIPYGDVPGYIEIYLHTGEFAHGQYPATGTPTLYAKYIQPGIIGDDKYIKLRQWSTANKLEVNFTAGSGTVGVYKEYDSSATSIEAWWLNNIRFGTTPITNYMIFFGEINISEIPAYDSDEYLTVTLSGGQETTINNNAYGTFEMNSPYFDLMAGDDSTKLIEYDSNLYYYLDSDNIEQFDFCDGEVLQTRFVPYVGRNINTDDKRIPTQLSAENRNFTLSLLQKDVYKYDLPLRTSTFRIVTSSNDTYDLYYKFNFVPLYEQYDYSILMGAFKDNDFYFVYGFETLNDNNVQLAISEVNYDIGPMPTVLFKKFTNDTTNKVYTNNVNRISFPLLIPDATLLNFAIVFAELYSGTEVCNINFDNVEIDHIEIYKDDIWKIARRNTDNSDNLAVLNIFEDDNTGNIVPSTYYPDSILQG
jgi:hypothetical protein